MNERSHASPNRARLLGQLDRLIKAGKITTEDAQRLRASSDVDFEQAVSDIRLQHIRADIEAAVARGAFEPNVANALMEELEHRPNPALLGTLRRKLHRGRSHPSQEKTNEP